jgi:uncharacterized membrane protein YfcA
MFALSLFLYAFIGIGAGFLAGLLGMSGGIVTVPCLLLVFTMMKFPSVDLMQLAMGTSLAAMVFNAISATYSHHQAKAVDWKLVKTMLPGLILGCVAGAFISYLLSTAILKIIFGVFALIVGLYFYRQRAIPDVEKQFSPAALIVNCAGFGVSTLSNILGIGGGTMMVPLFVAFQMPMSAAVGSSAATGFIISLGGAISYLAFGLGETIYPHTLGFIYLPAFFILSVMTFLAAPFGARMTHRIASDKLKKYFAICLIAVGIFMMMS